MAKNALDLLRLEPEKRIHIIGPSSVVPPNQNVITMSVIRNIDPTIQQDKFTAVPDYPHITTQLYISFFRNSYNLDKETERAVSKCLASSWITLKQARLEIEMSWSFRQSEFQRKSLTKPLCFPVIPRPPGASGMSGSQRKNLSNSVYFPFIQLNFNSKVFNVSVTFFIHLSYIYSTGKATESMINHST